jgi:hypothetical protein
MLGISKTHFPGLEKPALEFYSCLEMPWNSSVLHENANVI